VPWAGLLLIASLVVATDAWAEPVACQRSILMESVKLARARVKALAKCEDQKLTGALPAATDCDAEPVTAGKIARAESKLAQALAKGCGGADRTCGTGDDDPTAAIGWPSTCPDFLGLGCAAPIDGCDDIGACLTCVGRDAVEQAVALSYDDLTPAAETDLERCQRALGSEMRKLFDAKAKALRTCWDARFKNQHANACPTPGDGKAELKIAAAASKARARICKACGGDDRVCGGGDDPTPDAIGFPIACPAGDGCATAIDDLDDVADCVGCVTGFDVDCVVPLAVPAFTPYPAACTVPLDACPTLLQLDADPETLDLDIGWQGISRDIGGPWLGRMTLAVFDCAGDGDPTCGTCTVAGPAENAGGAAFATRRCAGATWVACASDGNCTAAGVTGPCRVFLGPPNPAGLGGITTCALTDVTGPVTGTVDVEAGAVALSVPIRTRLFGEYLTGTPSDDPEAADPCPRCVGGSCDLGPRAGMPCTIQGHSTHFDDDVSLDCPPTDDLFQSIVAELPLATTGQALTVSAASPPCTASGFSTHRCLCETCNNASADPCHTDADCPDNPPGTPGICGGRRCLPSGTPCTTSADCPGQPCGVLGDPTKPNNCASGTCTSAGGDEGVCTSGPFAGFCRPAEPFRGCTANSQCMAPGDACVFEPYDCYLDNGIVGMSATATGAGDAPTAGTFEPTLAGLTCVQPAPTAGLVGAAHGLPGVVRAKLGVSARLE
jgi:hypothetical protein